MTNGVRRTKIVCTLGPTSSSRDAITALVAAGMDAARLNFSHGTHEDHAERAALVREVQEEAGRPLAMIADLQGPKLRIGDLAAPRELEEGEDVVVVGGDAAIDGELPVSPPVLSEVLRPGDRIMIDDGLVRLTVDAVNGGRVRATVLAGGTVASRMALTARSSSSCCTELRT